MNNDQIQDLLGDLTGPGGPVMSPDVKISSNAVLVDSIEGTKPESKPANLSSGEIASGESDLINEINKLRKNPSSYINFLQKELLPCYSGKNIKMEIGGTTYEAPTHEGEAAVNECISFLRSAQSVGELTSQSGMSGACKASINNMGPIGLEITDANAKLIDFGDYNARTAAMAGFGRTSGRGFVMDWIVGDGDASREYRNCLLSPEFKFIGTGYGPHNSHYQTMGCITLAVDWQNK